MFPFLRKQIQKDTANTSVKKHISMFSSRSSVVSGLTFNSFFFFFKDCPFILFYFIFLRNSFIFIIYLFIYFWLCWVFVSVQGLSLVAASGGHSSSRCAGLSLSRPLLLRNTSFRRAGSVVVTHGPNCSVARGIFPDQGSNPCALHWQADSQPLCHQGSPHSIL